MLADITPDGFQTAAMAWIGACVVVAVGVGMALSKIKPVIEQIAELFRRTDAQNHRIESQQQQITQVALNTPAPSGEPAKVEIVNSPKDPVPVHESK